jgi:large conductance mechanosensitive channel
MLKEFREFILRGNMVDMAIGIIIGGVFGTVVNSLVNDIIMPPIGYLFGGLDFSNWFITLGSGEYTTLAQAQEAGAATINIGLFVNSLISLLIVGLVVFYLVKGYNRLHESTAKEEEPAAPTTKSCPECRSEIPIEAVRCAYCTIELPAGETA